jgi:uncharacterized protein (DUF433 family)
LRYWDKTWFFSPEWGDDGRFGAFSRIYSFRDVVGLYGIALLRKRHGFSLQELRPVGDYLRRHHETPWASLAFYVAGRNVYFRDPESPDETYVGVRPLAQEAIPIELARIAGDLLETTARLQRRQNGLLGKIERNRNVAHNANVLAGTRVPTLAVWNLHKADFSTQQIVREYPRLTPIDVKAAIEFEAKRQRRKLGAR